MDRREFSKRMLLAGAGTGVGWSAAAAGERSEDCYEEPAKRLPIRTFDVVVAGGGTGGVVAAIAAARQGVKTALIELKGYPGGTVTEGGTALHSFYNLWRAFPGVEKRQVVKGIAQEIIDRLMPVGGCTGHAEMLEHDTYDSVCTAIDTELYKLVVFEMLVEAGVQVFVNTRVAGAIVDGARVRGAIVESRAGREAFYARSFVDCTAYGDLAAQAGADSTEPNGIENLFACGMMITSDHRAHMSTGNTVCRMGQGQGAGTAAALCAARNCGTRDLPYGTLRDALNHPGMYFET